MKKIQKITVLGAGSMGAQIAALAAEAGYTVTCRDIEDKFLQRGLETLNAIYDNRISKGRMTEAAKKEVLGRVTWLTDLKTAVKDADFIIEAVPEIMDLKKRVVKEVTALCPDDTVFATNTSSLSITEIASAGKHPELVVGAHYFNPPSRMTLLEVIRTDKTSADALKMTTEVAVKTGRAVVNTLDTPGFIANRIFTSMANEADWAIAQGEARDAFQVDSAIKYKLGLPMGMLELQDTLGGGSIETQFHVMEYFGEMFGKSYGPAPILTKLFKQGHGGKKTGKGYYDWSDGNANEIPMNAGADFNPVRVLVGSVNEAAKLLEVKATTKEEIDTAMLLGLNYPRGILRLADSYGIDTIVNELNRLYAAYKAPRYRPSKILSNLVKEGKLGRKTGEGFYSYGPGQYEFLKIDVDQATKVATLTLNRPTKANAFVADMVRELDKALTELEADAAVRCVVITGAGANFSGGADFAAFASGEVDAAMSFSEAPHDVLTRIETYAKPVIAAINGPAMGLGLELAVACDVRVMNETAIVRLPELTLGLLPGAGATQRVGRLIGWARAKEMVLLTDPVDAKKALDWGLVTLTAAPKDFKKTVDGLAVKLANGAPLAQKYAKGLLYYGAQADQRTALYLEAAISGEIGMTRDLNEGITAMNYRREPKFTGK